jgi:hypothetical protein
LLMKIKPWPKNAFEVNANPKKTTYLRVTRKVNTKSFRWRDR